MAAAMERASNQQARDMREQLLDWLPPSEIKPLLQKMAEPHGFFAASQGNMQFWREAWCGSEFALHQNSEAFRLCKSDPPDFEIISGGAVQRWELAEIRQPNTRVNATFAEAAHRHNVGIIQTVENFDLDYSWLSDRLSITLQRKASKNYPDDIGLCIYIHDVWLFDDQIKEITRTIT